MAALLCLVVAITDGDTLKVRCADEPQQIIRLAEIDAPEKPQPYGQRSGQALSDLCYGKQAEVKPQTKDRYGRTVARVMCGGVDANMHQVEAGMAWAYTKYQTDPAFSVAQDRAKTARLGLWADGQPVPPWVWRPRR